MNKFSKGDIVRCPRTGVEAEVLSTLDQGKRGPPLVLCTWRDDWNERQEVYFLESSLTLVSIAKSQEEEKAKEQVKRESVK